MKRYFLILLMILLLISGACSNISTSNEISKETQTEMDGPTSTPMSTPTPTSIPDFSETDFSGVWVVAELIDSEGEATGEEKIQSLGGDFTLELLKGGEFFVCDEDDTVLGQGTYRISQNQLTLTAADKETTYVIQDEDTLRYTAADSSITVMKREADTQDDTDTQDEADTQDDSMDT